MHPIRWSLLALLALAPSLGAQADTTRPRTRADSVARATRDSIALMRELTGALSAPDSGRPAPAPAQGGPANARLLPDISAVGDMIADLSPDGSTQEDGARLGIREVELAIQAVVDPYFRGDIFLGMSDVEGLAIEQAFLTATSLPHQLEARLGRFLMPVGKQNTTHRHDLHTIEYPYVLQRFLGEEGLKGTGLWASRVFSPFGFYQEVQATVVDRIGERPDALTATGPANRSPGGLGYSARLRNYVDLSEAANVELSFSGMTGKREQPLDEAFAATLDAPVNAALARQTVFGADVTWRWRPLQQGLYRSFILQGEIMRQLNERNPALPAPCVTCAPGETGYAGPARDYTGAYVFARYQTGRRTYIGSRYDLLQDADIDGRTLHAGSLYLEWFPSEFSKLVAGYEGVSPSGGTFVNRLLLQATFAVGPHKPHPF